MRKSTRRILKTVRALQAELESEDDDPATAADNLNAESENVYVNDKEEAASMRREEEEEESDEDDEEEVEVVDEDHGDEDLEERGEDEDEPANVQVIPQKRKNGKDKKKPTSKSFHAIFTISIYSKFSTERVNRRELEEVIDARKITYNLTIFSLAELAKPQARREPAARFFVQPSNLEWPDIHAQLKIKAADVLYAGQAAIADDAYEMTFCIARHVSNPLPLSCTADYKHLVENALRQQQPTVKIIIKATQVCSTIMYMSTLTNLSREPLRKKMYQWHLSLVLSTIPIQEAFDLR